MCAGSKCLPDADHDGVPESGFDKPCTGGNTKQCNDNCPDTPNYDQADSDGDGIGDACRPCFGDCGIKHTDSGPVNCVMFDDFNGTKIDTTLWQPYTDGLYGGNWVKDVAQWDVEDGSLHVKGIKQADSLFIKALPINGQIGWRYIIRGKSVDDGDFGVGLYSIENDKVTRWAVGLISTYAHKLMVVTQYKGEDTVQDYFSDKIQSGNWYTVDLLIHKVDGQYVATLDVPGIGQVSRVMDTPPNDLFVMLYGRKAWGNAGADKYFDYFCASPCPDCDRGVACDADGNCGCRYWQKRVGGEGDDGLGKSVVMADHSIIAAGSTKTNAIGKYDAWLTKLNMLGKQIASWSDGTQKGDSALGIAKTDSGVVTVGWWNSNDWYTLQSGGKGLVALMGQDLSAPNISLLTGDLSIFLECVIPLNGGDLLVGGCAHQTSTPYGADAVAWRLKNGDASNILWTAKANEVSGCFNDAVLSKTGNSAIFVGNFKDSGGCTRKWGVMKVSLDGDILWKYTLQGNYDCEGEAKGVTLLPGGDAVVVGQNNISNTGGFRVIRISDQGKLVWDKMFAPDQNCTASGVTYSSDLDSIVVAGQCTGDLSQGYDGWVTIISKDGELQKAYQFGGANNDAFYGIQSVPGDGFVMVGASRTDSKGERDGWVVRVDKNFHDSCCVPNCIDKECGDDGCGGSCGKCGDGQACQDNKCVDLTKALFVYRGDTPDSSIVVALQEAGFAVTSTQSIPQDLSKYGLVIVRRYDACNSTTAGYLKNYVNNGGGVVLTDGVPYRLGMSSIAEWFGASNYANVGVSDATVSVDNPLGTSLKSGDVVGHCDAWGGAGVTGINSNATVLAKWNYSSGNIVFAFTFSNGSGRTYFQGSSDIKTDNARLLFTAGCKWVSNK